MRVGLTTKLETRALYPSELYYDVSDITSVRHIVGLTTAACHAERAHSTKYGLGKIRYFPSVTDNTFLHNVSMRKYHTILYSRAVGAHKDLPAIL